MVIKVSQHQDILDFKVQEVYRGRTAVVCLSTAFLTSDTSIESLFETELLPTNGYSRITNPIAADAGNYDSTTGELSLPQISAEFTTVSTLLQWQSAFVLLDGSPIASKSFTPANVDSVANTITLISHGLVSRDRLIITVDPTGILPSGIDSATRYYIETIDVDNIKLHASSALNNLIEIDNTGSGTFQARYANGRVAAIITESEPVALLKGQSYTYQITLKEKNL